MIGSFTAVGLWGPLGLGLTTSSLGLARFLSVMEDTTGALFAFVVLVLIPGLAIFLMAQKEFIRGLTSGATKG